METIGGSPGSKKQIHDVQIAGILNICFIM